MKSSLAIFLFACICSSIMITCSEKSSLLKRNNGPIVFTQSTAGSTSVKADEPATTNTKVDVPTTTNEPVSNQDAPQQSQPTQNSPTFDNWVMGNNTSSQEEEKEDKEPSVYAGNCFMKMHNWFYDLNPIMSKGKSATIKTSTGENIEFNICGNIQTECFSSRGLVVEKKSCNLYAGSSTEDKYWDLTSKIINLN